jgi:hypothetical protein
MTAVSQHLPRVGAVVGLAAHLPFLFWFLASGLLAPLWAVAGLVAVWTGLLLVAIRWWRTRPLMILTVPLIDAVVWLVVISVGARFLGWTA